MSVRSKCKTKSHQIEIMKKALAMRSMISLRLNSTCAEGMVLPLTSLRLLLSLFFWVGKIDQTCHERNCQSALPGNCLAACCEIHPAPPAAPCQTMLSELEPLQNLHELVGLTATSLGRGLLGLDWLTTRNVAVKG